MKYDVCTFGDPVLREESRDIDEMTDDIRQLANDMIEIMREENGVGLAAQQIGRTESIAVIEVPASYDCDADGNRLNPDLEMPLAIINPKIIAVSDKKECMDEGCLSFPGISGSVERPVDIDLEFVTLQGELVRRTVKGFVARAIQHEMDHLKGVLFVDRMSPIRKIAISGQLKRLKRETRERLGDMA